MYTNTVMCMTNKNPNNPSQPGTLLPLVVTNTMTLQNYC